MNNSQTSGAETGGGSEDVDFFMDPRVQESIGRSLKAHYDDIINAPVPDKFLVLLAQLEDKESRGEKGEQHERR